MSPITENAVAGVATFSTCVVSIPGTFNFYATATPTGLTSATSPSFTVTGAVLASISFSPATATGNYGTSIALTAICYDTTSATLTSCSASISLTVSSGPGTITAGGGPYSPTTGQYTIGATFSTSGSYTVQITCGGCSGVTLGTATVTVSPPGSLLVDFNSPIQQGHSGQTYRIKLSTAPVSDVSVTISGDSTKLQVLTAITFTSTDWNAWKTVTLSATQYPATTTTYTGTITHTLTSSDPNYSGVATYTGCVLNAGGTATLPIYNFNSYTVDIESSVVIVEGNSATVSVTLGSQPTANFVLTAALAGAPAEVTFTPAALTFTNANWATPQSFTISVAVSPGSTPTATYNFALTPSGDATYLASGVYRPSSKTATVTVIDKSSAGLSFTGNVLLPKSSATGTYTVKLLNQPGSDVTVNLVSSVAVVSASPTSLTFTSGNWSTAQTVTLTFTIDSTFRYVSFDAVITHTATSADPLYSGLVATFTAQVLDFCLPGAYTWPGGSTCNSCPAGFDCTGATPTSCAVGSYKTGTTNGVCTACTNGNYCPSATAAAIACPNGYYADAASKVECTRCATGSKSTSTTCTACSAGSYSTGGSTSCLTWGAGVYCPSSHRLLAIPCPYGSYTNAASSTTCIAAPAGKYSQSKTISTTTSCGTGQYSLSGAYACTTCPSHLKCSVSTGPSDVCAEGTYRTPSAGVSSCSAPGANQYTSISAVEVVSECPPGTKANGSKTGCDVCVAGKFCIGDDTATDCPIGTYSTGGAVRCTPCPIGYYSASAGATSCTLCPAGSSCLNRTLAPVPCAALGKFAYDGSLACYDCLPGSKCAAGATTPMSAYCPSNSYCPFDETAAVVTSTCPDGTYGSNPKISAGQEYACFDCPPGKSCQGGTAKVCIAGEYCLPRSKDGMYKCPYGTFSTATGLVSAAECSECSAGKSCGSGATTETLCSTGTFCPPGTGYNDQHVCPMGTYTGPGAGLKIDPTACLSCLAGTYCPVKSEIPLICPQGTYNTITGGAYLQHCTPCDPGKTCPVGGISAAPTVTCTPGHYCPRGVHTPIPCPAGTYTANAEAAAASVDDCIECPAGKACALGSTLSSQVDCTAGYYCPVGTGSPIQYPCPSGTTCVLGKSSLSDCTNCATGTACPTGTGSPGACAAGYYCPLSTNYDVQFPCPAGYYSASTTLTASADCTICPTGQYCPEASTVPIDCPAGAYASTTGTKYLGPGITDSCKKCDAGKFCAAAHTVTPADCAGGTYSTEGLDACITCVAGYKCAGGTSETAMYAAPCAAGYICPAGTTTQGTAPSKACDAGYYCPQGTQYQIDCPPGTYRDLTTGQKLADCSATPAGYFTNLPHSTSVQYLANECAAGYYCPAGSTYGTVIACPAGTFRATTKAGAPADCAQCTAGMYCRFEATVTPTTCPAGSYCPAGSITPTQCPKGTYNPDTGKSVLSTDCKSCAAGKYCDEAGATAVKGNCKAGFLCISKATTSTPTDGTTGKLCPKGGYCEAGTPIHQPCLAGTFNDAEGSKTAAECRPCIQGHYCDGLSTTAAPTGLCDAGYYCLAGSNTAQQHPARAGYYAPIGSIMDVPCLPGTYTGTTGQASCTTCTIGSYCDTSATSSPTICPAGYYCPLGSIVPQPCPPGTYYDTTGATVSTACKDCSGGNYCKTPGLTTPTGQCSAGYFCTSGAKYFQHVTLVAGKYGPCPAGQYCVIGTTTPVDCLAGTYNPSTGGSAATDCLPCPAGYFCSSTAMSSVGASEECPVGYFCTQGQSSGTVNQCPVGYRCPAKSPTKIMCEAGTYQDTVGQTTCPQCPQGYFCPPGTGVYTANPCPAGYYCPAGTQYDTQYPCPTGKFNPDTGKTSDAACQTCTAGKYCNVMGMSAPAGDCAVGFYCSGGSTTARPNIGATYGGRCTVGFICPAGATAKTACTAGSYCAGDELGAPSGTCYGGYECVSGATVPAPTDGVTGSICPVGYYCVAGAAKAACAAGTFLPYTGGALASECLPCVPGYICPTTGMTTPTVKCPAGYICASGVSTATVQCPAGSMCPLGSAYSIKCPVGSYQNVVGQATCITCVTAGKYCPEGATAEITCEAGYYCPLDLSGYTSRQPCPVGTFNSNTGSTSSTACASCTPGKYCDTIALSAVKGDCTGGYYCSGGAISATPIDAAQGGICTKGYYCPAGSTAPIDCTAGSYCAKSGLSAVSGQCLAGYYCTLRAWKPNPTDGTTGNLCSIGNYCPTGSPAPTQCLAGTYNPAVGLAAAGDCLACPYGYYCAGTGLTTPTGQCTAGYYCGPSSTTATNAACTVGHYCPAGSFEPVECPMGTYQDQTAQSTCKTCTAGNYCTGGNAMPQTCPVGYYCPAGTRFDKEFPCPDGTYADTTGLSSCKACTAGFICNTAATAAVTPCPVNKYCASGSSYGLFCELGTYNAATLGLASAGACTACPAGKYCVDGTTTADCEAGYYCAGSSSTPTPPSSSSSVNGPCSTGYYCDKGATSPTICPPGKVNPLPGGAQVSACTTCPPGYYCVANNPQPIPCPAGAYCPQGVQVPTKCRIHTYNPSTLSVSESSCIVCPAGYICTDEGAVTYDVPSYKCPAGYYCVEGGDKKLPCPPGTFTNSTAVGSYDACTTCSGGHQCPGGGRIVELGCPEGTYCPIGSAMPKPCLVGYYCPTNTTAPIICPAGYFCPKYALPNIFNYTLANVTQDQCAVSINPLASHKNTSSPFFCPENSICPQGSFEPQYCEPGQYVKDNMCINCQNGTYSRVAGSTCQTCNGGYICLSGAKRPDPTSIEIYGGYRCPVGHYCPPGALSPVVCPVATYNPKIGMSSNSSCLLCPANSYNDEEGRDRCTPCGSSSQSVAGSTICDCLGANRAFQKTDGTCRCIPGYEFTQEGFTLSVEDSTSDCFPKVFKRCSATEIRGPNGDCKSENDCSRECGTAGGIVMAGVGICQCSNVRNLDDICNKNCRDRAPVVTINSQGNYIVRNTTTNRTQTVNLLAQSGYYGAVAPGSSGRVYSIDMQDTGPKAQYNLGKAFSGYNFTNITIGRRLQAEDEEGIVNPVACLSKGDTFIFSIPDSEHFPVYNKDSLLNTNPDFDFGPFLELKRMITSASTEVTVFAFTFNESGIYDFSDNSNSDTHIIVSVIGGGQTCPDSDVPLKTRTQASILTLGTSTDTSIIEDPDWGLIGGIMGGFVGIISLLIGGLYVFFTKEWKHTEPLPAAYRTRQQESDLTQLRLKHHPAASDEDPEILKPVNEFDKMVEAYDDIDPSIFQSMHDRMLDYHKRLAEGFDLQTQEARNTLMKVLDHLEKLRNLLESRLGGLNPLLIKDEEDERKAEKPSSRPAEVASPTAFYEAMVDKYLGGLEGEEKTDELRDRVMADPNLNQQDKDALMRDLEAEMQRIQMQADRDKLRNNDLLQQRLLERKRKRVRETPMAQRGNPPSQDFSSSGLSSARSDAPLRTSEEQQTDLQRIEEERITALQSGTENLKRAHQNKLNKVMSQDEADALMKEFERDMKLLEDRVAEEAAQKRRQLEQRLSGRRKGKVMPLHIPGLEVTESIEVLPGEVLKADPAQIAALEAQHEEERQRLLAKQDQETQLLSTELDEMDPESIRARLARGVDNEAEKKRLMAQLQAAEDAIKASESGQQRRLEDRLLQRQQRKNERKMALKRQHDDELTTMLERQLDEEDKLKSDLELDQLMEMIRAKEGSPEQLAALVRKLLDEKHDQELANLAARKQGSVVEKQMATLQQHLSLKAERLADIRVEARRSGVSPQEEKDAIARVESDYMTNLRRDMDSALGRLEDEYRRKLMELSDRQMRELEEVLRCIRALDPSALQRHLASAQQELEALKSEAEGHYQARKAELDADLQALENELQEEEARTKELDREVEERKKRLEDVAMQRQKLEARQRELREKLKAQGISQEEEESILRKHQQELEQWDKAVEEEMARQRAILEKKKAARLEKQQARKAAVQKEEQRVQAIEDQPRLSLIRKAGVPERLIEPFQDLETRLRVDPLPRMARYTVEMENPENLMDSLLKKVKQVEQMVETVDAQHFTSAIEALQNLQKLISSTKTALRR